jgi:putative DNA primase/helicase
MNTQRNYAPVELGKDEFSEMLAFIPNHDRAVWVRIGGALKHELAEGDAFELWDAWSSSCDSYNERDARAVWRSLTAKNRPATAGTIVRLALENGYRFPKPSKDGASSAGQKAAKPPVVAHRPRKVLAPVQSTTEAYAKSCWATATADDAVVAAHPYAQRKHVGWAGGVRRGVMSGRLIGQQADCLLVPCFERGVGQLQGVQAINANGQKQSFGRFTGGTLLLGNTLATSGTFYVAEGWATAFATVFHHGGAACAVSFGKGNLDAIAELVAHEFRPACVAILAEVDE